MAASTGLASILLTKTAPAVAQDRELKLLTWSHFVPSSDEELQRQLEEFGKMAGIRVRMDRVAHLQLPAIMARPLHHRMVTYKALAFFSPPKICQRGVAYPQCHS
jgi:hypothetical protein